MLQKNSSIITKGNLQVLQIRELTKLWNELTRQICISKITACKTNGAKIGK